MSRNQPVPTHRERLIAAMIEVVGQHGYLDTTVAHVLDRAGVSRATFYELFADKEDCFSAAHRDLAKQVADDLRPFVDGAGTTIYLGTMLAKLLELIARRPAAARVLLIESLASGAQVRGEREQLMEDVERVAEKLLAAEGDVVVDIPTWALLGGLTGVITSRLLDNEHGALPALHEDLMAWIGSYELREGETRRERADWDTLGQSYSTDEPANCQRIDEDLRRLPRGRHQLPERVIEREHRERIIAATARVCTAKGYAAVTVADIVAGAGISRNVFYAHFGSKREAFAAAQALALRESIAATSAGFLVSRSWPERVWSAARAFVNYAASVPELTHLHVVESYAAGPDAIERLANTRMAFTIFLEEGYRERPEARALPRLCSEAIAGAGLEMLYRLVNAGRTTRLGASLPELAYTTFAPFLGSTRAFQLVAELIEGTRETHPDRTGVLIG